ncbi:hypothetical protein PWT90_02621 [Aphanocladium album]|nr:hypothetical protein PWT90_02621 [Aphanocladium album]
MMATEPVFDKLAEVSVPHRLSNHPNGAQHGVHYSALNGSYHNIEDIANKRITSVEEQLHSTDVSVSGGSDTEASRAKDGDKSHSRTGSAARKPAMFKAVSVNKTFLAAKASSSTIASKTTERPTGGSSTPPPGSSALSASRPRLVVKSGGGGRDSMPRYSNMNGGKSGSVPDANAVWNKNRPPEPKKFTDEELKKYGIHMASRLNEDDAQGQNKWADIDDDDEDWAPEAITWGDGTKTKLPHPDENPPHEDVPQVPHGRYPLKHEMPPQNSRPEYSVPRPAGLPSGKGLVLKNATQDRPALVAKPPQPPAPAKSPWAQLPPVDRPQQPWSESTGSPRGSYKEPSPLKMMGHPPKEIAADDFNRSSWRESQSGNGGRELYNSQSGRLEPAPDRRGSMLSDHSGRQPAVLQRQGMDHPEPSGAFQTNRNQDGAFNRRRASSTVSGGSGLLQRGGRGHEGQQHYANDDRGPRRPSFSGSNEGRYTHQHGNAQGPNRQQAHWGNLDMPDLAQMESQPPDEDDVEYQKKLMKERIELARKRRQEEVAREEAARKERIQKKLEALGPAPEKKNEKKEGAGREDSRPTQIHRREGPLEGQPPQHSAASPKDPNSRRLSQTQDQAPPESWAGTSPRPDRLSAWGTGPNGLGRNVWGSPDNDRGLGNGTFNPDLGRIPGATGTAIPPTNGAQPLSLPAALQAAPIGSRASRYEAPGTDLASKWVAAVTDSDKKLSAARLAEHVTMERQLAERGLSADDAQPVIKETWRQVHAPGDGTRQVMNSTEVQIHAPNAWKSAREDSRHSKQPAPAVAAGVIGSGPPHMLQQNSNSSSQLRASRFFPAKDQRLESPPDTIRPPSPSAPPPTMEGHPAYEGDAKRPQVSLPKPQPIVKLPPAPSPQMPVNRQQAAWGNRGQPNGRAPQPYGHKSQRSAESSQEQWQDRINSLLHKGSPPKSMAGMDVASRSGYEHNIPGTTATVVLPGSPRQRPRFVSVPKSPESKPMAEECFEEQEMGSLPIIRLPTKTPDAAWQAVIIQFKPLPKRFAVHASIMEPFRIADEHSGNSSIIRVNLPGMQEQKTVAIPQSGNSSRGGRGNARPSPRHRGGGRGGKRDTASSHGDSPTTYTRGNRGNYRGKGSDNWNRNSTPAQTPLSA